jgi:hypothetical protein
MERRPALHKWAMTGGPPERVPGLGLGLDERFGRLRLKVMEGVSTSQSARFGKCLCGTQ